MHQSGHSRTQSMQTVQLSSTRAMTPRVRGGRASPVMSPATGQSAGTPGGRRAAPGAEPPESDGSFSPGHGLATRAASTKSLRSGAAPKPAGSSSGSSGSWPVNPTPNISCVSRSCQAAPR